MKKLLFLILFSFALVNIHAAEKEAAPETKTETKVQNHTIVLNGLVTDNATNETLAGAVITVNGQKVYSDLDGNFTINNVTSGKCEVKVSMISYADQTIDIDTQKNNTLTIKLKQR